jgi:hypothetical protein
MMTSRRPIEDDHPQVCAKAVRLLARAAGSSDTLPVSAQVANGVE